MEGHFGDTGISVSIFLTQSNRKNAWMLPFKTVLLMNLLNESLSRDNTAPNSIVNGLQTQRVRTHSGSLETHLEVGEEPVVVLQDGVHAVCHCDRVLPVVVRDPAVVLLHRHDEAAQLFQLEAVWKRHRQDRNVKGQRAPGGSSGLDTWVCAHAHLLRGDFPGC